MEIRKKINYWLIAGVIGALVIIGYYSYLRSQEAINNGVYTIARICPNHVARHGWKVNATVNYNNRSYDYDPVISWEHFSSRDTCKTFFVKILDYAPEEGILVIPRRIVIPDSIQSAPPKGWTETWMQEHFPEIVKYVHDTR